MVSDVNDKIGFAYYFTRYKLTRSHNEYKNKICSLESFGHIMTF